MLSGSILFIINRVASLIKKRDLSLSKLASLYCLINYLCNIGLEGIVHLPGLDLEAESVVLGLDGLAIHLLNLVEQSRRGVDGKVTQFIA